MLSHNCNYKLIKGTPLNYRVNSFVIRTNSSELVNLILSFSSSLIQTKQNWFFKLRSKKKLQPFLLASPQESYTASTKSSRTFILPTFTFPNKCCNNIIVTKTHQFWPGKHFTFSPRNTCFVFLEKNRKRVHWMSS